MQSSLLNSIKCSFGSNRDWLKNHSDCPYEKNGQFVDSASFVNNVKAQISRGLKTIMESNLFQVTEKADQMIQQFFQEKKKSP